MAVFGMQLVITMVMASVLSKIIPHYSLAKLLLCNTGLEYYLHPSDDELRSATGIPKKSRNGGGKSSSKGGNKNDKGSLKEDDSATFNVPKNLSLSLSKSHVGFLEVISLRYYSEYQWLMDFALSSAIVYTISEIYVSLSPPKEEVNLSMLWCLLVVGFSLKIMYSLTKLYFQGGEAGAEKTMVVLSFFIYLLIALGMLIISEDNLDLGLDLAYSSFNQSAAAFLKAQGLDSEGPASKVTFKIVLAFFCAIIGAFFTFPGLRLGKMHWDALKSSGSRAGVKLVYHSSFMAPVLLVVLWIKPLSRRYFTEIIFQGYTKPFMTPDMFDLARLCMVVIVGMIRLGLMPLYLQSYLNMANDRLVEQRKETGKISNKELQKKIARVFYYLCVVTLQYAAPIILCIFLSLMCKTLGGLEWSAFLERGNATLSSETPAVVVVSATPLPSLQNAESVSEASKIFSLGLEELKKVFTAEFYLGVFGFATWWCVFSWFLSGTFGVIYQSYFTRA